MENQKVLKNINLVKKKIIDVSKESIDLKLKKKLNTKIIAISKRQPLD